MPFSTRATPPFHKLYRPASLSAVLNRTAAASGHRPVRDGVGPHLGAEWILEPRRDSRGEGGRVDGGARAGAAARVAAYRQKPLGPDPGAFVAALRPRSVLEFGIPAAATAAVLPESPA